MKTYTIEQQRKIARSVADPMRRELGWISNTTYEDLARRQCLHLTFKNDEPCGFLLHGPMSRKTTIYQLAISEPERWEYQATALVAELRKQAAAAGAASLALNVAADLAAVEFWPRVGARIVGTRIRSTRTNRLQLIMSIDLRTWPGYQAPRDQQPLSETQLGLLRFCGLERQFDHAYERAARAAMRTA